MKFDQKCYLRNKFTKVIVYNQVLERVGVIVELSSEVKPIIFASFFWFCFFAMARMGVQLNTQSKDGCTVIASCPQKYKSSHYSSH